MPTRSPDHHYMLVILAMALLWTAACAPATSADTVPAALPTRAANDIFPDSAVPYPAGYRTLLTHYATIERPDATVRDLYINREALDELRRGRPLPNNTIIVIDGYDAEVDADGKPVIGPDGRYIKAAPFEMLHVAQRRSNWAEADFPSVVRTGRWNFGSFDATSGARFDEDLAACFNCHQAMPGTDFLYAADHLIAFVRTGEVQYEFCNLRRRLPC